MTVPTPASVRKLQESKASVPDSPQSTSGQARPGQPPTPQEKTLKNSEGRVPRLLVNHPELEQIMIRLKEDEEINRKHGWYDRNRHGKQNSSKKHGKKPSRSRASQAPSTGTSSNEK